MPIAVIFVFVAGAIAIFVLYPHLRIIAAAVIAVIVAVGAAYFLVPGGTGREVASTIAAEALQLTDVDLVEGPRYTRITGRVVNGADVELRSFVIQVTLNDCETPDTCLTIGQDSTDIRVTIPPGQARDFQGVLDFRQAGELRGSPEWDFQVTSVTATP